MCRDLLSMCASVTNIIPNLDDQNKISGCILPTSNQISHLLIWILFILRKFIQLVLILKCNQILSTRTRKRLRNSSLSRHYPHMKYATSFGRWNSVGILTGPPFAMCPEYSMQLASCFCAFATENSAMYSRHSSSKLFSFAC